MDTNMVLDTGFNELVFENRHKQYGAYQIRKHYKRNVLVSVLLAVSIFSSALVLYVVNLPDAAAAEAPKSEGHDLVIPVKIDQIKKIDDPKPQTKARLINPPPKGPDHPDLNNVVVTKDSVKAPPQNDSAGTSTKGVVGGTGSVTDTMKVASQPCTTCDTEKTKTPRRVVWVPKPPKDPGLDAFFAKNIHYPEMAKEQGIEGTVWLSFVVGVDGNVREIKIEKGVHPLLDREVLRVAAFMPKWDPVTDNGEPVEYVFRKPVHFMLSK